MSVRSFFNYHKYQYVNCTPVFKIVFIYLVENNCRHIVRRSIGREFDQHDKIYLKDCFIMVSTLSVVHDGLNCYFNRTCMRSITRYKCVVYSFKNAKKKKKQ